MSNAEPYPHLKHLLDSWFHQDFDLDGDVDDIIRKFVAVSSPAEVQGVVSDIDRLLQCSGSVDKIFFSAFNPSIDPAGWGMTVAQWLQWVRDLLLGCG